MRALIFGIDSFTGRYLAAELERAGYQVFGTAMQPPPGSDLLAADLRQPQTLRAALDAVRPQAVFNLAGISFVDHPDRSAFYQINTAGVLNLLQALAEATPTPDCVLLSSSANVYGNASPGPLDENTLFNPISDYAASKAAMEMLARPWMDRLPIIITRPFNYTGIGQLESFLVPKIVAHFKRRDPAIELGNLEIWRDFSDVRDVAAAYRRLAQSRERGLSVNICSGRMTSIADILRQATAITGHPIEVRSSPALARTRELRALCGSADRLRSIIGGWDPADFENTLRWMIDAGDCPAPTTA